jgi:N-acetyl-anhydromuramyl-L-alanine amidase AmpD
MTYRFVQSATDLGIAKGPRLAMLWHMAEGGGTVGFLSRPNPRGVSVHFVIEYSGEIVQMLQLDHMHSSVRPTAIRTDNDAPYDIDGYTVIYGRAAAYAALSSWADVSHGTLGPNHATIAVEIEGFAATGPNEAQRASIGTLAAVIGIPAHLGHRDFQDYKACPGHKFPWQDIGHGPAEDDMAQLPITDTTPHMVDVAAPMTFYGLDGQVESTGHGAVTNVYSPYKAMNGTSSFYAIYAGPPPYRLILTKPSAIRDVPATGDTKHELTVLVDDQAVFTGKY